MAIYLKINDIKGSVSAKSREGCIDVHNYQVAHYRHGEQLTGHQGSRNLGLNKRTPIVLTKSVDNASAELFDAYTSAKTLSQITFSHTAGSSDKTFQEVTFKDVQIDRFASYASSEGTLEELTLSFMQQETRITPADALGKSLPAKSSGYDFARAVAI